VRELSFNVQCYSKANHYGVKLFPSTDSAKNAVNMFPRMDSLKDIHSVLSFHVECVVRIQRVNEPKS